MRRREAASRHAASLECKTIKILFSTSMLLALLVASDTDIFFAFARKSSSAASAAYRGSHRGGSRPKAALGRKKSLQDEYDQYDQDTDEVPFGLPDLADHDEELLYDEKIGGGKEEVVRNASLKSRVPSAGKTRPSPLLKIHRGRTKPKPIAKSRQRFEEEPYEKEYLAPPRRGAPSKGLSARRSPPRRGGGPSSRNGRNTRRSGTVVPYAGRAPGAAASAFTRGLSAVRDSIPNSAAVRDAAVNVASVAKQTTSKLSSNIYREVKGLTSSELEQVMLKATRPDDSPVKGKHVERLVGVTYQISGRYDIYDAVLRKLWSKMAEKDWRTTIKALYVLHRFSSDGAPEHQPALKARLRELRRTRDPKTKDKFFSSKLLLAGDTTPQNIKFRAYMARYAHYVLLRAQYFGGMFNEIGQDSSSVKSKSLKPITSTSLRTEHLEAAQVLLKAGVACSLKDGEECENTALAVERVCADLIGLTSAIATALNRALKSKECSDVDFALIKNWCEFYSEELLPQTKVMVKSTASKLDAYGLFLPSRINVSVSPELLQQGLRGETEGESAAENKAEIETNKEVPASSVDASVEVVDEVKVMKPSAPIAARIAGESTDDNEVAGVRKESQNEPKVDDYDEYDYDEEEYYDNES